MKKIIVSEPQVSSLLLSAENVAHWYFRLNGVFNMVNFIVHSENISDQRTDVDILGVRFPYRKELLIGNDWMKDDNNSIQWSNTKPHVIMAEVKIGRCELNGPWTKEEDQNMERVLRSVGVFSNDSVKSAAEELYKNGYYDGKDYKVILVSIGSEINKRLENRYPKVPQILWNEILKFIYHRFKKYERQKTAHRQWDKARQELWQTAMIAHNDLGFVERVCEEIYKNRN